MHALTRDPGVHRLIPVNALLHGHRPSPFNMVRFPVMITLQHHSIPSLDYFEPVQESVYKVDNIDLNVDEIGSDSVCVPEVQINLSCDNLQLLSQLIDPLG